MAPTLTFAKKPRSLRGKSRRSLEGGQRGASAQDVRPSKVIFGAYELPGSYRAIDTESAPSTRADSSVLGSPSTREPFFASLRSPKRLRYLKCFESHPGRHPPIC